LPHPGKNLQERILKRIARLLALVTSLIFIAGAALPFSRLEYHQDQTAARQTPPDPAIKPRLDAHVVMISIDGLIPEYYTQPARLGLKVPNLTAMKLGGSYADGVEGVYPSVTYPAHTTLITGARPATHGIVQNRIFEPPPAQQTGEWYWFSEAIKCETLWSVAKKYGLSTASVGWPVTVGADIDYNVPEIFDPKDVKSPKRTIQYSTPGLLEKALGGQHADDSTDGRRTRISEYIIENYKPNLMLIHLIALDDAHHKTGPRSRESLATAERMDAYVGRIIAAIKRSGIFDKTTLLLVSDHGFAPVEKKFEPGVVLVKEKLINLDSAGKPQPDWKAYPWNAGGSCAIVLKDPDDKETGAKVTEIFQKITKRVASPIYRISNRSDLDRLGAIPSAVLMLDATSGFAFGDAFTGPEIHDSLDYRGTHGHLPSRQELRSALIIYGETARIGARVGIARMIDIGPTAAAALGLVLPNAEGLAIRELLKSDLPIPALPKKKQPKNKRNSNSQAPSKNGSASGTPQSQKASSH
jgi:predicted AlkP superfamily pyrophosphatase or phosphodiesterase